MLQIQAWPNTVESISLPHLKGRIAEFKFTSKMRLERWAGFTVERCGLLVIQDEKSVKKGGQVSNQ